MGISLTVTKPFAKKCLLLCKLVGKYVRAKVMAAFRHKNQLDALIQFPYV